MSKSGFLNRMLASKRMVDSSLVGYGFGDMGGTSLPVYIDDIRSPYWKGNTWAIDEWDELYNVPTLGNNLIVNWNMETGNPPSSWTAAESTITGVPDERTGRVGIQSAQITEDVTHGYMYQGVDVVPNFWYALTDWTKAEGDNVSTQAVLLNKSFAMVTRSEYNHSPDWYQIEATDVALQDKFFIWLTKYNVGGLGRHDDCMLSSITDNTLFRTFKSRATHFNECSADWYVYFGGHAGVVCNLDNKDNPKNFILWEASQDYIRAYKVINGVYEKLIDESVTLEDFGTISVKRPANNVYKFFYNNSQVGTDLTISNSEIISNSIFGTFSTYEYDYCTAFLFDGI